MPMMKTCSGFGVEAKPRLVQAADIATVTSAALGIAVAKIAGEMASQFETGAIRHRDNGGVRPDVVLLEAARRLIERKEP